MKTSALNLLILLLCWLCIFQPLKAANEPPTINAGPDLIIIYPQNIVSFEAMVNDDGLPNGTLTYLWNRISGPGEVVFNNQTSDYTDASFSVPGNYIIRVTVSDGELRAFDEVNVNINYPEIIFEAEDQNLSGATASSRGDGYSGKGYARFENQDQDYIEWNVELQKEQETMLVFHYGLNRGERQLKLTVNGTVVSDSIRFIPTHNSTIWKDLSVSTLLRKGKNTIHLATNGSGGPNIDYLKITGAILPSNKQPSVYCGAKQEVTIPATIKLSAASVQDDGLPLNAPLTFLWSKTAGPDQVKFDNATVKNPVVTFNVEGNYLLKLTVTDSEFTISDSVEVVVYPEGFNKPPQVYAGSNIIRKVKTSGISESFILNKATMSDDGNPGVSSVNWKLVSGPGNVVFLPSAKILNPSVNIKGKEGVYIFRVTASDGELSATDELNIKLIKEYKPAESARRKIDFNIDWKFIKQDESQAKDPTYNDSGWQEVSLPHTYNEEDTYDNFMEPGGNGERSMFTGKTWYRKHFTVDKNLQGKKLFIEFEGIRQVSDVYLNGNLLGSSENGFLPFGFDLTPYIQYGQENVLSIMCDNTFPMNSRNDSARIIWHDSHWHPTHGGIYRPVYLHLSDPLHVTLPLYSNLKTTGVYTYTDKEETDAVNVGFDVEVQNEYDSKQQVELITEIIDPQENLVTTVSTVAIIERGAIHTFQNNAVINNPHRWSPAMPSQYTLYNILKVNGKVKDVYSTKFGIRYFTFDAREGFSINGQKLKLHGWGQKPTNEWAGLGAAFPDWMHRYTLELQKEAGGNFIRWGHSAGSAGNVRMADEMGIITLQPGVDGEGDCQGGAWKIRTDAFRDMIIYFRNSPSLIIYEGGNQGSNLSEAHRKELWDIYKQWDPKGKREFTFRRPPADKTYLTVDLATEGGREFDDMPVIEAEYNREESPRRVWDNSSPPDFDYVGGNDPRADYDLTSEEFAVNQVTQWWTKMGSKDDHCGGANWIFSGSTSHGRMEGIEVCRTSGEVDAVRLPKEAYYACQTMWREEPRVHIIGHWSYPEPTTKKIFVVSNCQEVKLFVNDKLVGRDDSPKNKYIFEFDNVNYQHGTIKAIGFNNGLEICNQVKKTAGEPKKILLTPITDKNGLTADRADIVLLDVEVVDENGNRCPTDQSQIDFSISGPAVWRGGYNSGKEQSTNNLYLDTECGINRVAVRSSLTPGIITVRATRNGLEAGEITIESHGIDKNYNVISLTPEGK